MDQTVTRSQEIRKESLFQLYGSKEIPLSASHIRKVCKREGFDYSELEIRDALYFLTGQGFAERLADPGSGEIRHRITSKGMLHYEQSDS
jgi:repressor of nif and glnA expression